MADYGIVLLTHFARASQEKSWNARDLSDASGLPLPTVSKILKTLTRSGILASQRGVNGGYRLTRAPENITVREMLIPFEGPMAVTECAGGDSHVCEIEANCPVKGHWRMINSVVQDALKTLRLSDMALPLARPQSGHLPGKTPAFHGNFVASTVGGT